MDRELQKINDKQNKKTNERFLDFFHKNLQWFFVGFILASVIQIIFTIAIIFNEQGLAADNAIIGGLGAIVYICFIYSFIFSILVSYPCYLYQNKAFISDIIFLCFECALLIFFITISIYGNVDRTITRINATEDKITIYMTHAHYVYLQASNWLSLIFSGASIVSSICGYYFASSISEKPWKMRVENEKVISKPKN